MILSSPSSAEFAIISCWFRWFQHPEQDFHLKYSAMEIYSEYVKDLYSSKGYPLRLLGDPEVSGSTSAMEVSIPIAFMLPGREHDCNESFNLRRPPALS
ncbi:hypothetical protein Tco_0882204 [Tanacetum coccineum]